VRARTAIAALAILAAVLPVPVAVGGNDGYAPQVADLRVVDDTGTWTAETNFRLRWTVSPKGNDVTGVGIRLRGAPLAGAPPYLEIPGQDGEMTGEVEIPTAPGEDRPAAGTYTVEVWAKSTSGDGPPQHATLRVDNQRPGPATPNLDAAWFRGDVAPILRIAHPAGPLPVSGIRGYAVSLRRDSGAPPCAGPDRCSEQETDLAAGIDDDEVSLGLLPEGIHVASVVAVSKTGMRSAAAETAFVRIDATRPELNLDGVGGGWSNRPVRVVARAADPLSGMAASGPTGPRTVIAVDGGPPTIAPGDEAAAIVRGSGVHGVAAGASDAAGNVRGGDSASPPLTGLVRIDEEPPSIAFSRAGDPANPELLEAAVSDPLSGPAATGGSIGVRPHGSDQAFQSLPTRSVEGRLSARWDSDSYPRGSYEFRATGYDAAGNLASSTRSGNGAPMVLVNPVKVPSAVRLGFGGRQLVWHRCVRSGESRRCRREVIESFGRRPATRVVPYGRGIQVGGQALSAAGAPLAGVAVELVESFDAGALATTRVTRLQTGADGTFFAHLAPGPSRRVEARFGGSGQLTRSTSRALRLGVQAAVRFRASSAQVAVGGRPVVFSGRILRAEATIPEYGRPIQFQFRLPGSPWTEFRTVQTDQRGRFHFPYSFSDDDSRGVRFLFRAYAPPQPGWPYDPAASRPVAVTGR
jgi:hypothetical protein